MFHGRRSGSSFLLCAWLMTGAFTPSWGASIVTFGHREPGGGFYIEDASLDGSVLVGSVPDECSENFWVPRAFRWTAEAGMQTLRFSSSCQPGGVAKAVSADGSTVVGLIGDMAFRWTASDGMQEFRSGLPSSEQASPVDVSADGSVVVGNAYFNGYSQSVRWTSATGWKSLNEEHSQDYNTRTVAVSEDGALVLGMLWGESGSRVFLWSEGTGLETIPDDPAHTYFEIIDVAPDCSSFIGWRSLESGHSAYRGSLATGFVDLLPPPAEESESYAASMSHRGDVIAGRAWNLGTWKSFLWTEEGARFIPSEPPFAHFIAERISGDGSRLLGYLSFDDDPEGVRGGPAIRDDTHGARLIADELEKHHGVDLQGFDIGQARGISFDGSRVYGVGVTASGEVAGWVADLEGGCRDTQEEPIIAGAPRGPQDPEELNILLDSSSSNVGGGDPGELVSRAWEIVSGPGVMVGAADGLTAEIHPTGLGHAVVRLTVDDGVCENPASTTETIHFCDVRRASNAMFIARCDVEAIEAPRLSADGKVVLGRRLLEVGTEATRWTLDEGELGLGDLPSGPFDSHATDLSADGAVIVGVGNRSAVEGEGFRWSADGGMVRLGPVSFRAGGPGLAVSGDGSLVAFNAGGLPVYWTEADGIQPMGGFGSAQNFVVKGASHDGSYLLVQDEALAKRLGPGSTLESVSDLEGGSTLSVGNDISADGSTIVGLAGSALGPEAILWTSERNSVGLGDLPGGEFSSEAHGVTADGSIVVGKGTGPDGPEAFIWDEERGMRSLKQVLEADFGIDLGGWKLEVAHDVSANGLVIVGSGLAPWGAPQTWLARLDLCGDPSVARIDGVPDEPVSTSFPVILDGGRSRTGGGVIHYLWEVIEGAGEISGAADAARVTIQSAVPGVVRVRLSIDGGGCGGRPDALEVEIVFRAPSAGTWVRCNANGGTSLDIADAVHTLNFLFGGGPESACPESTDCNGDGLRDLSDAVYLLSFLFTGGEQPASPYPDCEDFPTCEDACG